jgi:hypothetical protein|tara:strand:- start:264 stop:620 length:357 start_codon:yes stop_codon:yes gene_type:complete
MADIITFPRPKLNGPPQSQEEVAARLLEFKTGHVDQIAEALWQYVLTELIRAGCLFGQDEEGNKHFPAMVLILESIKSLHLSTLGIHHPLQDFAEDSINIEDYDEELEITVDIDEDLE